MADDTISIRIRLRDAKRFAVEMRQAAREIKQAGNEAAKANAKARSGASGFKLLQNSIKPRVLVLGMALLATAVGALTTNIFALVAAAAPAVGIFAALPGLAVAGGQGLGVLAFGLSGVTKAVGGLNDNIDLEKFGKLTNEGQRFAITLQGMKAPIRSLQGAIQRGLFPGLTEGIRAASPALKVLRGPLEGTGRVMGGLAARLGKLVGSRGFLTDLRDQAKFNNVQLKRLGGGGLHLVNVFRNLIVASRPLVAWVVKLAAGWAAALDRSVALGRANGGLTRGFHTIQVTVSRVGRLFLALGRSLWNIGRIGKQSIGDSILLNLLRASQALERWTESAKGTAAITNFFTGARRLLHDITDLLRPLLAGGGTLTALKLYAQGLGAIAKALDWISRNVPGANTALGILVVTMIAFKRLNVIAFAGGVVDVFKVMRAAIIAAKDSTIALRIQLGLLAIQERIQAARAGVVGLQTALASGSAMEATAASGTRLGGIFGAAFAAAVPLAMAGLITLIAAEISKQISDRQGLNNAQDDYNKNHPDRKGSIIGKSPGETLLNIGKKGLGLIPHAAGGITKPGEVSLINERGPELVRFPTGTRIAPMRSPSIASVQRSGGRFGGAMPPIHVHVHSTLKVAKRVLATITDEVIADERARLGTA